MSDSKPSPAAMIPWIVIPLLLGALAGYGVYSDWPKPLMGALGGGTLAVLLGAMAGQLSVLRGRVGLALEGRAEESEKISADLGDALRQVLGQNAEELKKVQQGLAQSAGALEGTLAKSRETFQSALDQLSKQMSFRSTEWGDELAKIFNEHSSMQQSGVDALVAVTRSWEQSVEKTLREHAGAMQALATKLSGEDLTASLERAAKGLGDQVASVHQLAANVDRVLQVSQVTDTAIQSLNSAGDIRKTLETFQAHLAESQRLLKEATKPRQFQLTEAFGEGEIA